MRMKINQKTAGGASHLDRLYEIAKGIDNFSADAYEIVTSAEILQDRVEQMFEGSEAGKVLKDEWLSEYHLVPNSDRRYASFQSSDTVRRTRAHEKLADDLSSQLFELYREMKQAASAPAEPEPSGLDAAIDAWHTAFDAWKATDKGDGRDLACDTPEALREQQALLALAMHPCASMDEVRRKADLFQSVQYLNGMAEDFTFDLLRSFAEAGGE